MTKLKRTHYYWALFFFSCLAFADTSAKPSSGKKDKTKRVYLPKKSNPLGKEQHSMNPMLNYSLKSSQSVHPNKQPRDLKEKSASAESADLIEKQKKSIQGDIPPLHPEKEPTIQVPILLDHKF